MPTLKAMFRLFDGYSTTVDKINKKTDEATNKILKASGATDNFNDELKATGASANKASGGLGKLVGTFLSLAAVKKGMDIADEFTNTGARLSLINDGLQTQAELQNKIFAAANRSKGVYSGMASAISKMGIMAKESFKSNNELIAFTELIQKSFKVGGASQTEQSSAMLQLTQAMSSGRLQGDEFRSIMENAPMIADAIAKYTGKSKGALKEMSKDGEITSDVIKNAMFMATDDINAKFKTMPMTFADVWNKIKNGATLAFAGVIDKSSKLINSDSFNAMVNNMINGLALIAGAVTDVISLVAQVGKFFSDNWSIIEPVILGAVAALLIYNSVAMVTNAITGISTFMAHVAAAAKMREAEATFAATAAQEGLNAALYICPITWIILAVIALIIIFYAVIAAINKVTGASLSATGIIMGAFFTVGAFIWNLVVGVVNAIIQYLWTKFVEPFIGIIEWVLNAANGGFNSFGGAVANLIGQIISWFLSLGKIVTKIIDAIFGTNWTDGLNSLQKSVLSWGKNDKAITISREAPELKDIGVDRWNYSDAYNKGYNFGKGIDNNVSSLMGKATDLLTGKGDKGFDMSQFGASNNPLTVKGKGKNGAVDVNMADEDLQYLRDIAERDYINKFSTATLAPSVQITFGDVHEEVDADKVAGRIKKILQEEIATAAEGAYDNV